MDQETLKTMGSSTYKAVNPDVLKFEFETTSNIKYL